MPSAVIFFRSVLRLMPRSRRRAAGCRRSAPARARSAGARPRRPRRRAAPCAGRSGSFTSAATALRSVSASEPVSDGGGAASLEREVLGGERASGRHDGGPQEPVLELAHVARPGVPHEEILGLGRDRRDVGTHLGVDLGEEMADQLGDVAAASRSGGTVIGTTFRRKKRSSRKRRSRTARSRP